MWKGDLEGVIFALLAQLLSASTNRDQPSYLSVKATDKRNQIHLTLDQDHRVKTSLISARPLSKSLKQ